MCCATVCGVAYTGSPEETRASYPLNQIEYSVLWQVSITIFYIYTFSSAFHGARLGALRTQAEGDWSTYSRAVQDFYVTAESIAEVKRSYFMHIGAFGLLGTATSALPALLTAHTLLEHLLLCRGWIGV
jgi:hypothetical protein